MTICHNCHDWDYLDTEDIQMEDFRDDGVWVLCSHIDNWPKPRPDWSFILWGSYSVLTCDLHDCSKLRLSPVEQLVTQ